MKRFALPCCALLLLLLCACASSPTVQLRRQPAAAAVGPAAAGNAAAEFPGYARVLREGRELWCQKRSPTGSRARLVEICHTTEELRAMAQSTQELFKDAGAASSHDSMRLDPAR